MPQKKKDAVHRYFTFDESSGRSKCSKCKKTIKGKHSTNLKNHIATAHPQEYNIVIGLNKDVDGILNPKIKLPILKDNRAVIKQCMLLVTVHDRPLALVSDDAFQKIINLTDAEVDTNAVVSMIQEQAANIRRAIFAEISNLLVSLKIDVVAWANRKFIGISIQYIKNGTLTVRNLKVLEVNEPFTETFLKGHLETVLKDFNVSADHIYCVCLNSKSNINKMDIIDTNYLKDEEDDESEISEKEDDENSITDKIEGDKSYVKIEIEYPIQIEIEEMDTDKDGEQIRIKQERDTDSNEQNQLDDVYCSDDGNGRNNLDDLFCSDDGNINIFLPYTGLPNRKLLCPSNSFQIAILTAFNDNVKAQSTLIMARKVVDTISEPKNLAKMKAAKLKNPLSDCQTNWLSTYYMLERLLALRCFCDTTMELSTFFWKEVTAILDCLSPAKAAIADLKRQSLAIGDFYIIWLNCKSQTEAITHQFAKTLVKAMQVRETIFMQNDVVLEALYLDRRLNLMLNDEQCEIAKSCLKETYQRIIQIRDCSNNVESIPENSTSSMPCTSGSLSALEDMLSKAEKSRRSYKQQSALDACINELVCSPRIPLNENIIKYWNNVLVNPEMTMVANTVLAAAVTRDYFEKIYKSLKFTLDPSRKKLSKILINDMLLVRENSDLME